MRPGREMDTRIAKEVFGYDVWAKNKVLFENHPKGERPLRAYSKEMEWAWEVAAHFRVALLPIEADQWFAFVGPKAGWLSPQEMLEFLQGKDFSGCGAAVGLNPAEVICVAALKAAEKRAAAATAAADPNSSQWDDIASADATARFEGGEGVSADGASSEGGSSADAAASTKDASPTGASPRSSGLTQDSFEEDSVPKGHSDNVFQGDFPLKH